MAYRVEHHERQHLAHWQLCADVLEESTEDGLTKKFELGKI